MIGKNLSIYGKYEKSYISHNKENVNPNKIESKSALFGYGGRSKSPMVNRSALLNVNKSSISSKNTPKQPSKYLGLHGSKIGSSVGTNKKYAIFTRKSSKKRTLNSESSLKRDYSHGNLSRNASKGENRRAEKGSILQRLQERRGITAHGSAIKNKGSNSKLDKLEVRSTPKRSSVVPKEADIVKPFSVGKELPPKVYGSSGSNKSKSSQKDQAKKPQEDEMVTDEPLNSK